jgi:hypothetical protein
MFFMFVRAGKRTWDLFCSFSLALPMSHCGTPTQRAAFAYNDMHNQY